MSLRTKLLLNYQSELKVVNNLKSSGHTQLEAATWDFKNDHEDDLISIDEVITELENRIGILANESCTEEEAETLNY